MPNVIIYCCDIGSTKSGAFGWVRIDSREEELISGNQSIENCLSCLQSDIEEKRVVTLGLECPLFLPVPSDQIQLSCGRTGEGNRSCFAPAGSSVAILGLHQLAYLLRKLVSNPIKPLLDWKKWDPQNPNELLLWEAFVVGDAHTTDGNHCQDAATAACEFLKMAKRNFSDDTSSIVKVESPNDVFSLAGSAVLWSGLSKDVNLLRSPLLVVKPNQRCEKTIRTYHPSLFNLGRAEEKIS